MVVGAQAETPPKYYQYVQPWSLTLSSHEGAHGVTFPRGQAQLDLAIRSVDVELLTDLFVICAV